MVNGSQDKLDQGWCDPRCEGCVDRDLQIAAMHLEVTLLQSQLRRLRLSMAGVVRTIGSELLEG